MTMQTVFRANFSDLFGYAYVEFGISWNAANDVFFRSGALRYGSLNEIYSADCLNYVMADIIPSSWKASDIPKDVIKGLDDSDKAHVILAEWFEFLGVDCVVIMDCTG